MKPARGFADRPSHNRRRPARRWFCFIPRTGSVLLNIGGSPRTCTPRGRSPRRPSCPTMPSRPPERVVHATAPARLDFAGGWSDTPPICVDRGGTVVNAAVAIDGRHPIEATGRLTDEPVIALTSRDVG